MKTKQEIINSTNGKFFSVVYINKKGESAKYIMRTGVTKGLKGGKSNCPQGAVTLYSISKNGNRENAGFRSMYLDKMVSIKTKHYEMQTLAKFRIA